MTFSWVIPKKLGMVLPYAIILGFLGVSQMSQSIIGGNGNGFLARLCLQSQPSVALEVIQKAHSEYKKMINSLRLSDAYMRQ